MFYAKGGEVSDRRRFDGVEARWVVSDFVCTRGKRVRSVRERMRYDEVDMRAGGLCVCAGLCTAESFGGESTGERASVHISGRGSERC